MNGIRLNLIVEGPTEESFVKHALREHLSERQVWVAARSVYTSRSGPRWYRGGMTTFVRARDDLLRWMKQDRRDDVRFSTMFDLYRLPADFPGMDEPREADPYTLVERLESRLSEAIRSEIDDGRFIPYLQLHEFEALILAEPPVQEIAYPGPRGGAAVGSLQRLVEGVDSPEEIDLDHPPSKRIAECLPEYQKVPATAVLAPHLPLDRIRIRCSHFGEWLTRLERLSGSE